MSPVSNQPESPKSTRVESASPEEPLSSPMTEASPMTEVSGPPPKLVRPPSRPAIVEKPVPAATSPGSSGPSAVTRNTVPPVPEVIIPPPEENDGRLRPIPPPSEPTQYRAIGVVRGTYQPSDEQYTRGEMLMADGSRVEAVLLGRVMSLVKNHLALDQEHVWVVYPRTREREETLHLQIVGVWEPENLTQRETDEASADSSSEEAIVEEAIVEEPIVEEPIVDAAEDTEAVADYVPSSEVDTDGFSIRGEIVLHEPDHGRVVVRIHQVLRKKGEKEPSMKFFKLNLDGDLKGKVLGYFWDLKVRRQDQNLVIQNGTSITLVMPCKYPKRPMGFRRPGSGGGGGGGFRKDGGGGGGRGGDRSFAPRNEGPPPVRKEGVEAPSKPVIKKRDAASETTEVESAPIES